MSKTNLSNRTQFLNNAKPMLLTINGAPMVAAVKEFTTGSLGWYAGGKTVVSLKESLQPLMVNVGSTPMVATPRDGNNKFSSGNSGWYLSGKTVVQISDTPVTCQVGISLIIVKSAENGVTYNSPVTVQVSANITVVGSKELPKVGSTPIEPNEPVAQPAASVSEDTTKALWDFAAGTEEPKPAKKSKRGKKNNAA